MTISCVVVGGVGDDNVDNDVDDDDYDDSIYACNLKIFTSAS